MVKEPTCEDRVFDNAEDLLKNSDRFDDVSAKSIVDLLRTKRSVLKANDVLTALAALEDAGHADP